VKCKENVEDFWSHDIMWSSKVLAEILVNATTSKSYLISLFDIRGEIFQSKTPLTTSVTREVWEMININEVTYTCGKWQLYHQPCSHPIACCTL
jgi:hypothetical protein